MTAADRALPVPLEFVAERDLSVLVEIPGRLEPGAVRAIPAYWVHQGRPVRSVRKDLPVRQVRQVRRESRA